MRGRVRVAVLRGYGEPIISSRCVPGRHASMRPDIPLPVIDDPGGRPTAVPLPPLSDLLQRLGHLASTS